MWREIDGVEFWQDDALASAPGVVHGFTTRRRVLDRGGQEAADVDRRRLTLAALGLAGRHLVAAEQVHGAAVGVVDEAWRPRPATAGGHPAHGSASVVPRVDALMTHRHDVCLLLHFADCVPMFVTDREGRFVGLGHAGWRGLAAGIPTRMVEAAVSACGLRPEDLRVALGPAIGRCCYEVGQEVVAMLEAASPGNRTSWVRTQGRRPHVDLRAVARAQLLGAGVPDQAVSLDGHCTACEPRRFFSHRRDGAGTGRMAALMALTVGAG